MITAYATNDPVVDFLSDQLTVHSRTLLHLIEKRRRMPNSVALEDISETAIRTRHTFALAKAAAERSRHTISSDSCFGQAVMDYIKASSEARGALPNPH